MKTARFTAVMAKCGKPEPYTAWLDPKKDPAFQRAVKAGRVMTVHQSNVGTRKDYGTIGFEPVPHALFLVFPRSLAAFEARRVVGVDYDKVPAPARAPKEPVKPQTRDSAARTTQLHGHPPAKRSHGSGSPSKSEASAVANVVPFERSVKDEARTALSASKAAMPPPDLVRAIRAAMREIKAGRAVAAYERLEKIVSG